MAFAYVSNGFGASVTVVDTSTNMIVATVPTAMTPDSLAITTDGSLVYVANIVISPAPNLITVIDTATNMVTATISIVGTSGGIVVGLIAPSTPPIKNLLGVQFRIVF